ncbi:hypothetical protein EHF33_13915 [Deinococcus psychrotolerans]|uniref:Spherulation-specific family 4 n=1 Tax=Deinococcus psychrotolerans TaxID=2489213 RepID=A0A3G8YS37_9DEIO|nr:spherulation-specific family 4 protein [Deinococcus psychrotolerans]AZI44016.1 hypothetical protein EHF33_13915 [Deinococcus psychrotolerans]
MKWIITALSATLFLSSCSQSTSQPSAATLTKQDLSGPSKPSLLIPMYMYPSAAPFNRVAALQAAHPDLFVTAILNTDLNLATSRAALRAVIPSMIQEGVFLVGYVDTGYGSISAADAKAKVNQWLQYFPEIQGIFFDQAGDNTALTPVKNNLAYFRDLYRYVRTTKKLDLTVLNPGTCAPATYFDGKAADFVVTKEGSASTLDPNYFTSTCNRDGGMSAAIFYNGATNPTTNGSLASLYTRVGAVYFTDDTLPNPYDALPAYLESVATALDTP